MDKKIEEIMNDEPRLPKRTSMLVLVLGVVGGTAFFVAVAVWYFTAVDRPPPVLPLATPAERTLGHHQASRGFGVLQ